MTSIIRTFIPGSEWLYFKIYAGQKTADKILTNEVYRFIHNLDKEKCIFKWFFIRYADPDFHIRLRLLVDKEKISYIMSLFYKKFNSLVNKRIIWKIQLDTYNREIERYGSHLIQEAESLFCFDSNCVISILRQVNRSKNENYRWLISLEMVDSLLSDFSLDLASKKDFVEKCSESFRTEFGFNELNSKQLNTKYRENKKLIELVLTGNLNEADFKKCEIPIFKRSIMLKPIVINIKKKLLNNRTLLLSNLLTSYIHMMIDRIFLSDNRVHELVIYDFLRRYYTSIIQRNKYNKR